MSASTQNQAFAALLFLYRQVLGKDLGSLGDVVRAKRPRRLPVVLTAEAVELVLAHLDGVTLLICRRCTRTTCVLASAERRCPMP